MQEVHESIAILDVGHGNSAVLIAREGVVVVDAGPKNALLEYLHQQAVKHIDLLLISHADQDHLGALAQLMASQEFSVGRVALNSDAAKGSATWEDVRYELDQAAGRDEVRFDVALVPEKEPIFDGGVARVKVLGPSRYLAAGGPGSKCKDGRRVTTNSISAVVGIAVGEEALVLFPGDIDDIGLDDLLSHNDALRFRVLVFPHHGGKPGTADIGQYVGKLCDAVAPEVVVFSVGRGLHGTPNRDLVATIRDRLPGVRIMCTQLSEHCCDVLPKTANACLNDAFCGGREQNHCCAGTVVIKLDVAGSVLPSAEGHRAFIRAVAKQALCM